MKFLFLFLGLSFFSFSCKSDIQDVSQDDSLQDSITLLPQNSQRTIQVTLQKEPQELVATWLAYITAQDEMEALKDADLQTIVDKSPSYSKIMVELNTTVPGRLQGKAVKARLVVLVTKTGILEQLTKRQTLDATEVKRLASEIQQDFENFKLQLNELFLKTPDQFEIELDDQLDSIQKANESKNEKQLNLPQIQQNQTENN